VTTDSQLCVRTLRLKVKREGYAWLNAAAIEVNQVWNFANAASYKAAPLRRSAPMVSPVRLWERHRLQPRRRARHRVDARQAPAR
jgi:hypothetical protein